MTQYFPFPVISLVEKLLFCFLLQNLVIVPNEQISSLKVLLLT